MNSNFIFILFPQPDLIKLKIFNFIIFWSCSNHIKMLSSQLQESYLLIQHLGKAIEEKHTTFDTECSKIQSEVSPIQSVKFLLWITRNSEKLAEVIPDFNGNSHVPNSRFMPSNLS